VSLAPAASVTLGSLRYDTQASAARVTLALLPRGGSAQIAFPAAVRFEAAAGDKAVVSIDGGEGAETVLTGKVIRVCRTFAAITVAVADGASDLAAYRPSATFEGQDAGAIVNKLAADAAVSAGAVDIDLDLAAYVAAPSRSAAEHIAHVAMLAGGIAYTDGDGSLNVKTRPSGPPDLALKYGREVAQYEVLSGAAVNPQQFAMGFGPAGSGGAPDALRPSVGALPDAAADGGVGVFRLPVPELRVPSAAASASASMQTQAAARALRLEARSFLQAKVRPGMVIEVQSLPDGLTSGPWLVTRVEHALERGAGQTSLWAEKADAAPSLLGGLLGAAAGAIGALL